MLDECTYFSGPSGRSSDFGARIVSEEADMRLHGRVERADLSTSDKGSKMISREESGARRDAVR